MAPSTSGGSSISGYSPAQIKNAYGISAISLGGVTGDGSGRTIAIVDAYSDPNIAGDLSVFDKQFGLADPPSFKQVSAAGSPRQRPPGSAAWSGGI